MTTIKFFQADWCGPCKQQKPVVEEIEAEQEDVEVEEFDVEDDQDVVNEYQVQSVPTLVVEKSGEVVGQLTGFTQKEEIVEKAV